MFDITKHITVTIPTGQKCTVKFPTDDQLCDRTRHQRTVRQNLGRGKTKTNVVNAEAVNAELFDQIVLEHDDMDEAEKSLVINKLLRSELVDVDRNGDQLNLTFDTPFGRVSHLLSIPRQRDVVQYNKASVSSIDGRRFEEIKLALEPAEVLYAKISLKEEGYAGPVPITMKSSVINAMISELQEVDDQNPEVVALEVG